MAGLWGRYMGERLMVTGSDYRSLNRMYQKYPEVDLAFKVAPGTEDIQKGKARVPEFITPKKLGEYTINFIHKKNYEEETLLYDNFASIAKPTIPS